MISVDKLFPIFKQMSFQNVLSIYLFRIIRIVFSLQFIQFQHLIPFRIILLKFFRSLLLLALYTLLYLTLTVGLNSKFNKTLLIIDKLVNVENDGIIHRLKHLLFKTNYLLSFAAIFLLLCTRYYTLRTLLLTLIQLLLLVLNISEMNWRKNQTEISLVASSNDNTNYVDGTILFSLLNPPPHTLPTENESYAGGTSLVGLLSTIYICFNIDITNESYGDGQVLFEVLNTLPYTLSIENVLWLILIFNLLLYKLRVRVTFIL